MQKFGIDISKFQGSYNIAQAKAEGVEFVIARIGGADDAKIGKYKDSQFENNYQKCKQNGVPIGAYYLFNAYSERDAHDEAAHLLGLLKGHSLEYPVALDVEGNVLNQNSDALCKYITACAADLEQAGYYVVIYMSASPFKSKCQALAKRFDLWIASYTLLKPNINGIGIWQYGGTTNRRRSNKVAGVVTDQNYAYKDYENIIKTAGLNGFSGYVPKACTTCKYLQPIYAGLDQTGIWCCAWRLYHDQYGVIVVDPNKVCDNWEDKNEKES